jgi:ATP-dependent RNA helicase DeaD
LIDHLDRGSIDLGKAGALVLDEADRLLDMGFREELDRIFAHAPEQRRTHLVSATFPRAVRTLTDRVQVDAAHVEGTRLGAANEDIEHLIHVIDPRQKLDAIVNLLLANPDAQTLVFARTRADVTRLAEELAAAGFAASAISGELDQAARNRTLAAFKQGHKSVLVATDVAARGIDLQAVTRVIHAELPTSADAYTHRAGRTGRAGRKGTSSMLVTPAEVVPATRLLRVANIPHRFEAIPSARAIERALEDRGFEELTSDALVATEVEQQRALAFATRLLAAGKSEWIVARLLLRTQFSAGPRPRELRSVPPPSPRSASPRKPVRPSRPGTPAQGPRRAPAQGPRHAIAQGPRHAPAEGPRHAPAEGSRHAPAEGSRHAPAEGPRHAPAEGSRRASVGDGASGNTVPFRVSWGSRHGADARKLLAILCRRGRIRGADVGAIRVDADHSIVEVQGAVAEAFAVNAARPDPRDPRLHIRPWRSNASDGHKPPKRRA